MTNDKSKSVVWPSSSGKDGALAEAGKEALPTVTAGVEDMSVSAGTASPVPPPQVSPMRCEVSEDEQDALRSKSGDNDEDTGKRKKPVITPSTSFLSIDDDPNNDIMFVDYKDESQLDHVMKLVIQDLSEPYSSEYFPYRLVQATEDASGLGCLHVCAAKLDPPRVLRWMFAQCLIILSEVIMILHSHTF